VVEPLPFAVIPTFVLVGPGAVLALLFPALFGALALFVRRWAVSLTVLSLASALLLAQVWLRGYAAGAWWGTAQALGCAVAGVALIGAIASYRWRRAPAFPLETALLVVLATGGAALAALSGTRPVPEIAWTFEAAEPGLVLSSPRVAGEHVYVSVAHSTPTGSSGAVYCLDRTSGAVVWSFNGAGRMKQVLSSPALADGRLYVGEGLHQDDRCRLYCLDAATGQELWRFATTSHVESTPVVTLGGVFFGAGDDGVYCLDTAGKVRWHFPGPHVDMAPAVAAGRVYAGSGHGAHEVVCLDAATGALVWRTPTDQPAFGAPAVLDGQVFIGTGNGKLNQSDRDPVGALLCLDGNTGRRLWRYEVGDVVFGAPVVAGELVCFGSRDQRSYGVDRRDGRLHWKQNLGSPITAAPVQSGNDLYIAATAGMLYRLDPNTGAIRWRLDLGKRTAVTPDLLSTPARDDAHLYLGAGLHYPIGYGAVVYAVKLPE
jgi:outer membrane protein assembly factor BamB